MIVHTSAIASEALGNMLGSVIEGTVGICGFTFSPKCQPTSSMNIYITGEEASGSAECYTGFLSSIKIFASDKIKLLRHSGAERIRQIYLFA